MVYSAICYDHVIELKHLSRQHIHKFMHLKSSSHKEGTKTCSLVQERLKMAALLDEALDFALAKAG